MLPAPGECGTFLPSDCALSPPRDRHRTHHHCTHPASAILPVYKLKQTDVHPDLRFDCIVAHSAESSCPCTIRRGTEAHAGIAHHARCLLLEVFEVYYLDWTNTRPARAVLLSRSLAKLFADFVLSYIYPRHPSISSFGIVA